METPVRRTEGFHLLPSTNWGRWTAGFGVTLVVLIGVFVLLIPFGPSSRFAQIAVPIAGILAAGCALAAFVAGLISVVFRHERSLAALVAMGLGMLALVPVVGEFTVPH